MKVLVLHTLPPASVTDDRIVYEFDLAAAAKNVADQIPGSIVRSVAGEAREILETVCEVHPDVVFNLCEAPLARTDLESHAAALFEWIGVPFTGCGSETLALCRRKDRTNALLHAAGIRVPLPVVASQPHFPCIVKPLAEDGAAGIHSWSVCDNPEELRNALEKATLPFFVQAFVPGREFVVSLWGRSSPDYSSIGEMLFAPDQRLVTYDAKWDSDSFVFRNSSLTYSSEIDPNLRQEILGAARGAWRTVGARHAIRVDIRLDVLGAPHVLDVNPNPEISPEVGICRGVIEAGWPFQEFVRKLIEWA